MICQKIRYFNFRNIQQAEVVLQPGVNVFFGDNAQGKTNLLEGIYCFAYGRSFRSTKEKEMIRFGEDECSLKIEFSDSLRERNHEIRILKNGPKGCYKEGIRVGKLSEFVGYFRVVLFCPEHLSLVKEGPAERRGFLDVALSQLYPEYMLSLGRYQKLLLSRNTMLKSEAWDKNPDKNLFEVLSAQLASEASVISRYRDEYMRGLSGCVRDIISDMTGGKESAELLYKERQTEEQYLRKLTENLYKEQMAENTLYGIHKDDVLISLNGREARSYASQGQQRSIALAMKLAEGEMCRKITGEYPVFLFDDILSELDRSRKEYILSGLEGRQVIITCCEEIPKGKVFTVKDGKIESEN